MQKRLVEHSFAVMFTPDSDRERLQRPVERLVPNPKLRLMDQCHEVMRFKRLALRSEQAYCEVTAQLVWGAHAPSRTPTGALAGRNHFTHAHAEWSARAPTTAREGACAPRALAT